MDEHQLRVMFEDFGPVFQINVLRDKITGQSKGMKELFKFDLRILSTKEKAKSTLKYIVGSVLPNHDTVAI